MPHAVENMEDEAGGEDLELEVLEREYRWVLRKEVQHAITLLLSVLKECLTNLPPTTPDPALAAQEEILILNPPNGGDVLKCTVGLAGNRILKADATFKIIGRNPPQLMKFGIPPDAPYQLQQLQDAFNYISEAVAQLSAREDDEFKSADEVTKLIQPVMQEIMSARTALVVPKKRTFDDLKAAAHRRHFVPPLPYEMSASFYLQAHKLIFALYQVMPGSQKFDCYQAEVSIPRLTQALVLMTVALQTCQQLLDKMNIFAQALGQQPKKLE